MIEFPHFPMTKLCLVTAVDVEFNAATSLLAAKTFSTEFQIKTCRGLIGDRHITVLQCGMGAPGFAEKLTEHLRLHRYDALIVAGMAGGLEPGLKSGDAVIYDLCHDGRTLSGSNSKEKPFARDEKASIRCEDQVSDFLFSSLRLSGRRCFRGAGVTVNRIITEARDKTLLGVNSQALAVDMESYDVLRVCAGLGLLASVLRVISDESGSDLPNFNWAAESDGRMNVWRTAAAMAARPMASLQFLWSIRRVINALRENLKLVLHA